MASKPMSTAARMAWETEKCQRRGCGHARIDHSWEAIVGPPGTDPEAPIPAVHSGRATPDGQGACFLMCGCRQFVGPK
jgi:hypothetical protein